MICFFNARMIVSHLSYSCQASKQTTIFLRDAGTLSPGDFHIVRWFWRNMVYIYVFVLFFSLCCMHSEENAPYSSYLNINFTWIHLNLIKCASFKQESCRQFWFKTMHLKISLRFASKPRMPFQSHIHLSPTFCSLMDASDFGFNILPSLSNAVRRL